MLLFAFVVPVPAIHLYNQNRAGVDMSKGEQQYLDTIAEILAIPEVTLDRTGLGTKNIFGVQMKYDMENGFPLLTTRFIALRIAFEELMWILRGQTDAKILQAKNIHIWDGNTTREFLDKKGLDYLPEGELGKGYGFQLRNFGATENTVEGFDQLKTLVEEIKQNPQSRRHYVSYWHPEQVRNEAALPPCHVSWYVQIAGNKLNLGWCQRSTDLLLGNPTNLAFYGLLLLMLAKLTGYEPGTLLFQGQDVHLYSNQFEAAAELLQKPMSAFPTVKIKEFSTLDEMLALEWTDIELIEYNHAGRMKKIEMAV